jgi:hypothetical protein
MGPSSRRNPKLLWVLPAGVLVLIAALAVLPRITHGPTRRPSPVTQIRPLDGRRRHDIAYTNEYLYDSTYETCEAIGLKQLARELDLPALPTSRVARAFADHDYQSALRDGSYHGCLDALNTELREQHHRGATYGTLPSR